jgi:hypothetical protein
MNIVKLIDISKTVKVSPEFQNDFSKMMKVFHEVDKGETKIFPKGKMENMIEQLIELIKKDEVIPMELTPVGQQLKEMLDSCERNDLRSLEQILKMRKNPQYKKYNNLLDFMGLSILTMDVSEKHGGYGDEAITATFIYIIGLTWSFFSIFTGILAGSITWKKLKKNGIHPALVGFTTFLVGIITTIIVAITPNTVYDETKRFKVRNNTPDRGGAQAVIVGGALLLEDPYLVFKIGMLMFLAILIVGLLVLIYQYVYKIYRGEHLEQCTLVC